MDLFLALEDIDLLFFAWLFLNLGYFVVVVLHFFQDFLPEYLQGLILYGKTFSHKKITTLLDRLLYVPNSWFTHFYIIGVTCCLFLLNSLLTQRPSPSWLRPFASLILPKDNTFVQVDCTSVFLGLVMLLIQVSRRLLECFFVSVFTGRIHVGHYIVADIFYVLCTASIAAPHLHNIDNRGWYESCTALQSNISWIHIAAIGLFIWASIHQNNCHTILANLRKTTKDKTVAKIYKIPYRDWFKYVSSPHYLAEILIYISLVMVQRGANEYSWFLLVFVIQNLSVGASNTHLWYNKKFKEYPPRKRLIPWFF